MVFASSSWGSARNRANRASSLARWGQLNGKQAVCFPGMEERMAGVSLRQEDKVVEDGDRITGRAAGSAFEFGLSLVRYLAGEDKADEVRRAIHY